MIKVIQEQIGTNATTTSTATQSVNGLMSSADKKKLDSLPTIYNGSYTYSQAVPSKSPVKVTISVPTGYYNKPIYVNASGTANYGDWITALGAVWLDSTRIAVYLYNHGDGPSTGNININYMLTK